MPKLLEPNTCVRGCCRSHKIPLHLRPSSFSLLSPIARGAESVVYEAILDGERVAAKKPVLSTAGDLDKFHSQLQLMWCVDNGSLDHPGVIMLLAAHARPPGYMFFFPFYESGNLADKIHVEEWNPEIHVAVGLAIRLANALQYLHGLGIVHRDVKPANILLDRNLQPHLADFGLAAYKKDLQRISAENWRSSGRPTGGFHKKNMVGTLIYMAPEILKKDIHTEKSDVYSFGISLNELLTGVVPYTDIRAEAQAHTVLEMSYTEQQLTAAIVSQGLRPVLAGLVSGAPSTLLSLIQKCWDSDPSNRPSFDEIVMELNLIMVELANVKTEECFGVSGLPVGEEHQFHSTCRPVYHDTINWFNEGGVVTRGGHLNLQHWVNSFSNVSTFRPVLSWGSFATCGRREAMEDTHFFLPNLSDENDVHLFGIFDGHRGAAAAEFCVQALPGFLRTLDSAISPAEALSQAFVKTDMAFRNELINKRKLNKFVKKDWHPGCTANAALIVRDTLFVANAGDCRTIVCRSGHPYALSKDHVASCPEERERVTKAGGLVKWQVDTWRVGDAALQVTRSIGDDDLKPAVTAEPDIRETVLSVEDEYLVMASDGLWDVISNEEVVSIIRDTVKEPGMCSKRLATEAAERGSKDNITVIVVFLQPVSTAERIY